jgi:hypothetical protein
MSYMYAVPKLNAYRGDRVYFSVLMFQLYNRWICSDEISY